MTFISSYVIWRRTRGPPDERKFEKELHEAKLKLHEFKACVYAVKMMLGKPKYMEEPSADVEIELPVSARRLTNSHLVSQFFAMRTLAQNTRRPVFS